jgi:hypothetical protein
LNFIQSQRDCFEIDEALADVVALVMTLDQISVIEAKFLGRNSIYEQWTYGI